MTRSLHSDRYAEVLVILRSSRIAAGLTQSQMAARLDRPQSYVSKLERGERRIDIVEFIDFAEALGSEPVVILRKILED